MKKQLTLSDLKDFQITDDKELTRQLERCERLGIEDNMRLLLYLEGMESQIAYLTEQLEGLLNKYCRP